MAGKELLIMGSWVSPTALTNETGHILNFEHCPVRSWGHDRGTILPGCQRGEAARRALGWRLTRAGLCHIAASPKLTYSSWG